MDRALNNVPNLLRELNKIGVALSTEKDHNRLLELILIKAMDITNSDGGTLYLCKNDKSLKFEIYKSIQDLQIFFYAVGET